MIDPTVWVLIALFVMNGVMLASIAVSPEVRAWHRVHYRWYAAFAFLTAAVAVLVSLRQILGG